jgi:cytochrome P450
MMRLALEILGKALLGVDLSRDAPELTQAVITVLDHIVAQVKSPPAMPEFIPTVSNRRFKAAMRTLDRAVLAIIESHSQDAEDLLGLLMQAKDETGHAGMNSRQLRDEVITILIAGHETVASALTWACYLLSRNPDAARTLREELRRVLNGRPPEVEDLPALTYTRQVFDETLRLYPPAWMITRKCLSEDRVGGYRIPKNALVIIGVAAIHHNATYWPDPERFDPLRFAPEAAAGRPRYAYLPFGGGPRLCIGNNFALAEAPLILASIFQRYQLDLAPGAEVVAEALVTLRPRDGLPMRVRRI